MFVVTHRPADPIEKAGGTTYHFVPSLEAALTQAREVGGDADVFIDGGADIVRQALAAGAVDEFRLHIVPIVFGDGTRPFPVGDEARSAFASSGEVDASGVAHLTLRPQGAPAA